MARVRKKSTPEEDEQEKIQRKGKRKLASTVDDDDGSILVDRTSIEEESSWILCQLESNINPLFSEAKSCGLGDSVNREDIVRFLELYHIKKYVDMKFTLYFPPADEFLSSGYKRPLMKTYYSDCRKAGLSSLARKIGNPEKFSSLVTLNKVGIACEEDPEESPEEMAAIYTCETFRTSEAVLKGARHMGHRSFKKPSQLFESIVVVGLHLNCDVQTPHTQFVDKKFEESAKLRSALGCQNQSLVEANIEPQVVIFGSRD